MEEVGCKECGELDGKDAGEDGDANGLYLTRLSEKLYHVTRLR